MKVTYITHACLLIEIENVKIITDPWLIGPAWGNSLWHFPNHNYSPKNLPIPDIIYFSHGHDDHFHDETINNFPKKWFKAQVIVPNFNVKWWKEIISSKFPKAKYLNHNEIFNFRNIVKFQMFLNDNNDFDSSLKLISKKIFFLQTDNLMSIKEAKRISRIEDIDVAFVLPFLTGVFPGFYKWNSDELLLLAKNKINKSLDYCSKIIKALNPKYAIPYACDLGYLGDKFYINLLHSNNKEDLKKIVYNKKISTEVIILNSGDFISYNKNNKFIKKITKYKYNFENFIRFANENNDEYLKRLQEEKLNKSSLNNISKMFFNKLKNNIKKIDSFLFSVLIEIKEKNKSKFIFISFKDKKVKLLNKYLKKTDLKVEIESYKINNLFKKKYPMNFLTFHNGGYVCKRVNMELSSQEKKYWEWINNLDFFI